VLFEKNWTYIDVIHTSQVTEVGLYFSSKFYLTIVGLMYQHPVSLSLHYELSLLIRKRAYESVYAPELTLPYD
jgi:hypothetical protein